MLEGKSLIVKGRSPLTVNERALKKRRVVRSVKSFPLKEGFALQFDWKTGDEHEQKLYFKLLAKEKALKQSSVNANGTYLTGRHAGMGYYEVRINPDNHDHDDFYDLLYKVNMPPGQEPHVDFDLDRSKPFQKAAEAWLEENWADLRYIGKEEVENVMNMPVIIEFHAVRAGAGWIFTLIDKDPSLHLGLWEHRFMMSFFSRQFECRGCERKTCFLAKERDAMCVNCMECVSNIIDDIN